MIESVVDVAPAELSVRVRFEPRSLRSWLRYSATSWQRPLIPKLLFPGDVAPGRGDNICN